MDIQALKYSSRILLLVVCAVLLYSCVADKEKDESSEEQQEEQEYYKQTIEERQKATELAYEYERFVNDIWQQLNLLSDSLTNVQTDVKFMDPKLRKQKMASIQRRLEELENRLDEAERNAESNDDKLRIKDLREAIKRKDEIIRCLKKENGELTGDNQRLKKELEKKALELADKETKLNKKEDQLDNQVKISAKELERIGDNLRIRAANEGGFKGNGNKGPLKNMQLVMFEASINCYKRANAVSSSPRLTEKIQRVQDGLEKYRHSDDISGMRGI